MPTLPVDVVRRLAIGVLQAVGTPEDLAQVVGDSLLDANLSGHDSHGVLQLTAYVEYVRKGQVRPDARAGLQTREQATAHIDGGWGWGQPAAQLAARTVTELAEQYGVGAAIIGRCNHIGRLGEYVESIARAGMAGLILCNTDAVVAPYGGWQRVIGTNPLALAVPRGPARDPLLLDFATSGVAEGKLQIARAHGEQVAPGLLLDRCGRPSQNPADYYSGGALLPFGGHKGYALGVLIELLGGALSGMAPSPLPEFGGGNGTLVLALDIARFVPLQQFFKQADELSGKIKATATAEEIHEVMLPGETEAVSRRLRLVEGITLPEQTWSDLQHLAASLQVPL